MTIYDVHQHLSTDSGSRETWLSGMRQIGVAGGAVFSRPPRENNMEGGADFETRLREVLAWCEGNDHADPILFVHPGEPGAIDLAREAAARGIAGFKMICNDYYVSDGPSMALIEAIAALRKPLLFHTGIIWNREDSSKYNRPVFWEALIHVKRLKFSLAHCSWPWTDECIALYGKFLNATQSDPEAPEMFFDLTPGTPEIYRRDLLYKLFHVGYDVPDNILFGSDTLPTRYAPDYVKHWLDIDNALYDEFGVPASIREKIYEKNYLRFLGKTKDPVRRAAPEQDSYERWVLPKE